MKLLSWRMLPLLVFIILALFLLRGLSLDPQHLPSVKLGKALPDFNLPQLDNPKHRMTAMSLKGQVALLNVWASWCPACVDEQVFMMELARQGVVVFGLNYKDKASDAKQWLAQWGNPYRLIAQDEQGKLAIDLGVYGAPETYLIDKKGYIQYRYAGILTADIWQKEFLPRMQELERAA